jgi:hypothetical protein
MSAPPLRGEEDTVLLELAPLAHTIILPDTTGRARRSSFVAAREEVPMRPTIVAAAAALTLTVPWGAAVAAPPDSTIDLPEGFAGEGVALGEDDTFYAGNRMGGQIARGDVSEGTSAVWVSTPALPAAIGLKADVAHALLWVAGGNTGQAAVYDLDTAGLVTTLTLGPGFINDVAVTDDAAYFTNSLVPELYRVPITDDSVPGTPQTIELSGPAGDYVPGFNLNGIAATADGATLIVVNSATGALHTVDPATGASEQIKLVRGVTLNGGDGILLEDRTLYVLQNGNAPGTRNRIAVVRLSSSLTSGRVVDRLRSPLFESATTLAKRGDLILAVNAQFAGAPIDPRAEVVVLHR